MKLQFKVQKYQTEAVDTVIDVFTGQPRRSGVSYRIADRLNTVRALKREIAALERKLRNEPQMNRKVELRRTLKAKQVMLGALTSPTPSPATGDTN